MLSFLTAIDQCCVEYIELFRVFVCVESTSGNNLHNSMAGIFLGFSFFRSVSAIKPHVIK